MGTQVNFEPLSPVTFLHRSEMVYPDKTAVVYEQQKYTYREFAQRCHRLANALTNLGIGENDKVAFICPNTPPMLEAHFAVPMIGAVLVSINIRLSPQEVTYILNHSDCKAVFVDTEFAALIESDAPELSKIQHIVNIIDNTLPNVFPAASEGIEYEELLSKASTEKPIYAVKDEQQLIAINYTSGTTGNPKGVMYHHRGAYLNALGEVLETQMNAESSYLWTLPLFHCNGWCFSWGVTALGATHVCLRKVEGETVFNLIEQHQVSHLCGAPTVLITLASYAEAHDIKLNQPLKICAAGAPPAPQVIANMEQLGAEIIHVYGLTEVFGPHSICAWQQSWESLNADARAEKKARQGVPYIVSAFMDVVHDDMTPVARDGSTIGEVVMRGNNVMSGYYKNESATADAFEGGWFHSGDLAVVHPDEYIQILDRKKDIIISGGENISTVEIENTLYKHSAVLEAAVVPMADDHWGEVPKAVITLKENATVTEQEIIDFCKANLARFKAPKVVEFGELPKTGTGKIQKFKLRENK